MKTTETDKLRELKEISEREGAYRARVFSARLVEMDERVRMKCQIPLCPHYGHTLTCPPNVPTFEEFSRVLGCYESALLIQTRSPVTGEMEKYEKEEVRKYFSAPGKEGGKGHEDLDNMKAHAIRLHLLINKVEGQAMALGFPYALGLIGGECMLCNECVGPASSSPCRRPYQARPSLEGVGIDVYKTSINAGLPFEMPPKDEIIWTGVVLVD
ncbi:MAG: DUF2284 domain-containing protein [Nitrospirota bacterium]|jgi:predicted metal-binding protein